MLAERFRNVNGVSSQQGHSSKDDVYAYIGIVEPVQRIRPCRYSIGSNLSSTG